ncbi:hypothetical protein CQ12_06085 [Bradyrhizobium jicamae]|uniref:PNPLA domain-containing protein n=1 Tax=Bradyrhizobium jicamae TaxID=280332 RepID=A0A0R3LR08_9BRAD|nr:hypothetical protein CQ12_06085 [Bradyrhizobium jicamae]
MLIVALMASIILSWPQQVQELYADILSPGLASWIQLAFSLLFLIALTASILLLLELKRSNYLDKFGNRRGHIVFRITSIVTVIAPILMLQLGLTAGVTGVMTSDFQAIQQLHAQQVDQDISSVFPIELANETPISVIKLHFIRWASIVLIIFLLAPYPARLIRRYLVGRGGAMSKRPPFASSRFYFTIIAITVLATIVFALPYLVPWLNVLFVVPQYLGALALIILFLALATLHFAALSDLGDRTGYPLVGGLFGLAVTFSFWNLNDNHEVATVLVEPLKWQKVDPSSGTILPHVGLEKKLAGIHLEKGWAALRGGDSRLPYLEEAFADWLQQRPAHAKERFKGRPYPIIIVAAEGGGIFAGAQTALFLARLYDRCPRIAHHLFAISAVSGGSLGAALISSLVKQRTELRQGSGNAAAETCAFNHTTPAGPLEDKVRQMLLDDHLAPLFAAGLFPDFMQRFLPFPITSVDRARALDKSIEQSWEKAMPSTANYFTRPFRDHWAASGDAPMLLLNTASVETGEQIVIAPFEGPGISEREASYVKSFFGRTGFLSRRYDVALSSAVGLSARFPGISPSGYLVERDKGPDGDPLILPTRSVRFVDGGFIDNSGGETALQVAAALYELIAHKNRNPRLSGFGGKPVALPDMAIEFHVLIIGGVGGVTQEQTLRSKAIWGSLSRRDLTELGAPVTALLNSRKQRATSAIQGIHASGVKVRQTSLPWGYINPPLGWKMTPRTLSLIATFIGTPDRCKGDILAVNLTYRLPPEMQQNELALRYIELLERLSNNNCTAHRMIEWVN